MAALPIALGLGRGSELRTPMAIGIWGGARRFNRFESGARSGVLRRIGSGRCPSPSIGKTNGPGQ